MHGGHRPLLRRWQTGLTVAPGDWGSLYLLAWLEGNPGLSVEGKPCFRCWADRTAGKAIAQPKGFITSSFSFGTVC